MNWRTLRVCRCSSVFCDYCETTLVVLVHVPGASGDEFCDSSSAFVVSAVESRTLVDQAVRERYRCFRLFDARPPDLEYQFACALVHVRCAIVVDHRRIEFHLYRVLGVASWKWWVKDNDGCGVGGLFVAPRDRRAVGCPECFERRWSQVAGRVVPCGGRDLPPHAPSSLSCFVLAVAEFTIGCGGKRPSGAHHAAADGAPRRFPAGPHLAHPESAMGRLGACGDGVAVGPHAHESPIAGKTLELPAGSRSALGHAVACAPGVGRDAYAGQPDPLSLDHKFVAIDDGGPSVDVRLPGLRCLEPVCFGGRGRGDGARGCERE